MKNWADSEQIDYCDCCEEGFFRKNLRFVNFQILCSDCKEKLETNIVLDDENSTTNN